MIPKVIHYCWFGGNDIHPSLQKCIDSWKKYCPDYKIIQWNESNYDVYKNNYIKEAYQSGFYAFVSDYARLDIIYNYGGIYLDTDVEIIKSLDPLLDLKAFMGIDFSNEVNTGLGFGSEPKNQLIKEIIDEVYGDKSFVNNDGSYDTTICSNTTTPVLEAYGYKRINEKQCVEDITIFPYEFFCPKHYASGKTQITDNTFSIHHCSGTWLSDRDLYRRKIIRNMCLLFPIKLSTLVGGFISTLKYDGIAVVIQKIKHRFL